MTDKKIPSPADALVTGMKNKAIKDNGGYLDDYQTKYVDHVMGNVIDILNNPELSEAHKGLMIGGFINAMNDDLATEDNGEK